MLHLERSFILLGAEVLVQLIDNDHGMPSLQESRWKCPDLNYTENNSFSFFGYGKIKIKWVHRNLNPEVSGMKYFRHTSKAKEVSVVYYLAKD